MRAIAILMTVLNGVVAVLIATVTAGVSAQAPAAQARVDMSQAAAPVASAVGRANQAIQELQSTLVTRLNAALTAGGPAAAVTVCRDEARQLTASVAGRHGIALGRTSHRLRNPANVPPPWAAALVAGSVSRKVAEAEPVVFDLGDRVGVMRPIGLIDFCVTCHGPREVVDAAIGPTLRTWYPNDQAIGFAPGDLRGWVWAEVPIR
jgi:hypothetical protein